MKQKKQLWRNRNRSRTLSSIPTFFRLNAEIAQQKVEIQKASAEYDVIILNASMTLGLECGKEDDQCLDPHSGICN